ncbi:MAG: DNA recombination protein RmuC [Deltaproteobacteria bacterium]|jgi:DNA recombination protein RmuC|nr:DNA recombination protein RmuC [Deltaproteobacteria bacterium]
MEYLAVFIIGVVLGAVVVLIVNWMRRQEAKTIAQELIAQTESQKVQDLEVIINRVKESFGALSQEVLSKSTGEFLKLADATLSKQTQMGEKELEGKKKLIDQTLVAMKGDLQKVQDLVTGFEKDREKKFGELANQLKTTAEQTGKLQETTSQLRTALASSKVRGQWGERMAEDVLRLAGFVEGINYRKQKTLETVGTRPDYTFLLPQDLTVNMDVKFPLDNYMRYLDADGETDKERHKNQFIKDVRGRIKEVTTREYINPAENTVDYVIVFIPNEQVYAFINENDSSILDEALKHKVILCSPITLYAVLAVIRQAVDNFNLEKTAAQIMSLLGTFNKQWSNFIKSLEKMGKKIDEAQKEFNALTSTRRNQLERPLRQIEDLRKQTGVFPELSLDEGNTANAEEIKDVES